MLVFVLTVVVLIGFLVLVGVSMDRSDDGCTSDIPCQECGQCYGDHFNAHLTNGHSYKYPRDFHRRG